MINDTLYNKNMNETQKKKINKKIKKTIIKNILKGGFCNKYKNDSCKKISVNIDPIAPMGTFLNSILNLIQGKVLNTFTKGLNFIIKQWNHNINILSNSLEEFILLIIFTINGYTDALNYLLDDVRLILKLLVLLLTTGSPINLLTIYMMPIVNELITFTMDTGTLDIITSIILWDFRPIINFIKASLHLLLGKTIKSKCNLEDYGNDKERMDSMCYEFIVPRCKVNIKTLFYITFVILVTLYISCWINFLKIFYPD